MNRLRLLAVFTILALLAACGAESGSTSSSTAPAASADAPATTSLPVPTATTASASAAEGEGAFECGDRSKLGKELHIFSWSEYWPIEDDNNLLKDFQQACGVNVTLDTFPSNEDLAAKLRAGNSGYDLVLPSDYMVDILIRENRLLKLDKTLLPNIQNLDKNQLGLYYDPGNDYSLPYLYGMTGIAYDETQVNPAPDSWAAVFDVAKLEPYQQKVSMLDDERESVGAALKYKGFGYNSTNPSELAQAQAVLQEQKASGFLYRYDTESVAQGLSSGEVVLSHAWNGDAALARSENPNIRWIVPKEGGVIWQDNLAIPSDAPQSYTAHVFINNVLRPDVGARIAEFTYYLTPNTAAEALLSPEVKQLLFLPDAEVRKRLEYIQRQGDPALYADVWTQIKGQ